METDNTNFLPGTIPDALKSSSSNKEKSRFYVGDDDVTTDEDSGFQASNERLEGDIDPLYHHSSLKNSVSDSSKQSSDVDGLQVSISSLDLEDCSVQSRSQSSPKVSEEIDLSILAKIEVNLSSAGCCVFNSIAIYEYLELFKNNSMCEIVERLDLSLSVTAWPFNKSLLLAERNEEEKQLLSLNDSSYAFEIRLCFRIKK